LQSPFPQISLLLIQSIQVSQTFFRRLRFPYSACFAAAAAFCQRVCFGGIIFIFI
jgi:hypothetical protein